MNITEKETAAMLVCLNYDTRAAQLTDNYSNGSIDDFMQELGWTQQQAAAVIGSLMAKGLATSDNDGVNGNKFNTVWLTERGVNAIFDIIEAAR